MNKKRINDWLPKAKESLEKAGIVNGGKIIDTFRSQISSFGAAVIMGSLPAAVAFFARQGESKVERPKLLKAMYYLITDKEDADCDEILEYVCNNNRNDLKEMFTDASISLKLAMNFYEPSEENLL